MLVCEGTDKNPFLLHTMWPKTDNFIFALKQKTCMIIYLFCPILKDEVSLYTYFIENKWLKHQEARWSVCDQKIHKSPQW